MAMKESSKAVFNFLKEHDGAKLTNKDIADALGVSGSTVTGSVNGLVRKGFAVREEVEIPAAEEGKKPTIVKYISLTDAGKDFDPDAEVKKED